MFFSGKPVFSKVKINRRYVFLSKSRRKYIKTLSVIISERLQLHSDYESSTYYSSFLYVCCLQCDLATPPTKMWYHFLLPLNPAGLVTCFDLQKQLE